MFSIDKHMVSRKSAMPYDYPPHEAKSSWLSDLGHNLAHSKSHLKR